MILKRSYLSGREEILAETPDQGLIEKAIAETDWSQFAFLDLLIDDQNYLNGSGCLPDDGLSVLLSVNNVQFVTEVAPASPEDLVPYYVAYLNEQFAELYGMIFDAQNRGLTRFEVEELRLQEVRRQS